MKRVIAVLSLILVLAMGTCGVFAASLDITGINPTDGKTGLQINNLAVKVQFSEKMNNTENDAVNGSKVKVYDQEGKLAPLECQIAHSEKKPNELWYVFTGNLEPNSEYTIKISSGIVANSGDTLANGMETTFKTRNTKTDSVVSIVMMVGMMAVMIIATTKAGKKAAQQQNPAILERKREEALNPYKIAKEKNISLEEAKAYVAKEKEKYRKEQEKIENEYRKQEEARQAELDALERQIELELAEQRSEYIFHVKERASFKKTGRPLPKAVTRAIRDREERKLAAKKAAEAQRLANMKGKKAKR